MICRGGLLWIVFWVSITGACQKENDLGSFPVDLRLELREQFVGNQRHMALNVTTVDDYPCANYQVDYRFSSGPQKREVVFKGLFLPDECLTAFGPARAYVEMGLMPPGAHELQLRVGQEHMQTVFHVGIDQIRWKGQDGGAGYLHLADTLIHRVSEHHVWGYVSGKFGEGESDYADFFNDLWDLRAQYQPLSPGNYGFFRVTEDRFILFSNEYQIIPDTPVTILYKEDFYKLEEVAAGYSDTHIIELFSGAGHHFHNQK